MKYTFCVYIKNNVIVGGGEGDSDDDIAVLFSSQ